MRYITIKDIANKLNFSVSTISRALNDKYDIKKETKDIILKTAEEMGYYPNPIAKKLIQKRSFNIGFVVPEFINSFFPQVIMGAQEVLFKKGYQVIITQSNECFDTEIKNVKSLVNNMVDGLIVSLSSETKDLSYYHSLIKRGLPIVFVNRAHESLDASKVLFHDYKWSFFATEHLINLGHKNIYHIAGNEQVSLTKNRKNGFTNALRKHNLRFDNSQILKANGFKIEDGERVAKELLSQNIKPDAIIAACDPLAIGAMKVFKNQGFIIPEDIAFVGFSESHFAEHIDPPLTSVVQPTHQIGVEAAKLILHQIEKKKNCVPKTVILNGNLNIRKSSLSE